MNLQVTFLDKHTEPEILRKQLKNAMKFGFLVICDLLDDYDRELVDHINSVLLYKAC